MDSEPEMNEALDLSLPKTKSADEKLSLELSTGPSLSDDVQTADTLPALSSAPNLPERERRGRKLVENDAESYFMKNKDFEPPSKKYKLSLTTHKGDSPPTAFVSRNADASDACLINDIGLSPPTPFLVAHPEDAGEIKRTCNGVSVSLHDDKLWRAFANFGTEMIINRSGRRMFPHIVLSTEGLHPQMMYSVTLEIVPADQHRYKFINNQWLPIGMADPGPGVQPVTHPDSPNVGSFWIRNRASFSKVRLTNNKESSVKECSDSNILLLSMHKYKVVIKIREESSPARTELTFDFDESAFIAVTAYQNSKITQLKIQNNPFAKAFRDCHNPSFTPKTAVSPRRREAKAKNGYMNESTVPIIPVSIKDCPSYMHYQSMPFRPDGLSIAALDHLYRKNIEMNSTNPSHYFPWTAVGQHWPFQFWGRNPGLIDTLYSKMNSSKTNNMACLQLPVNENRRIRSFSVNSQTSSSSPESCQDNEDSGDDRKV